MGLDNKQKKRLLIFSIIPVLAVITLLTDDVLIRAITVLLIVILVGFIIFFRDSFRTEEPNYAPNLTIDQPSYSPDEGEMFKIISPNKNLEVITAENYVPERNVGRKNIFKPPDLKEAFEKIANEEIRKDLGQHEQFLLVLERILNVIKDAYVAHSAVFFIYDKANEKLTMEKFVSSSNDITERKFEMEDDILSKIVQKEEPEILTDISPTAEADVIRYYSAIQGIKSFVGVPMFYKKKLTAILAVDSKSPDAFGIETIYSLGRFVRVISIMISLFAEKHKDSVAEKRLKGLLDLWSGEKTYESEDDLYASLEESMRQLLSWDAFTLVYFDPLEQKFVTSKVVNNTSLKYIGANLEVELKGTLVGKSIVSGMPVKIDDTSANNFVRFSSNEDVSFDGSFLAIPLVYDGQNYAILCFESLKKNAYTNADVQFISRATKIFAFVIYSFSTRSMLQKLLAVDIETRTLNAAGFKDRLLSDLLKSNQLNIPGALALVYIDDFLEQDSLFEGNPFPKVLAAVTNMIKAEITPVNLFGRLDEKLFGVFFFNATTKDAFLWAEKLRVKIARKPIAVVAKQTTYTVSIGVAPTNNKLDVEEVLTNANLALQKAIEKGGNNVKNIN